jgi:hypothetical protein
MASIGVTVQVIAIGGTSHIDLSSLQRAPDLTGLSLGQN